jgi:hypothetical protein
MPTIRTRCPTCRQRVAFAADTCALLRGPDGTPVAYAFVCPGCSDPVVLAANRRIAEMLVAGGVSSEGVEEHVAGLPHPERPAGGRALTPDDLLDFHLLLATPGWFRRLVGLSRRPDSEDSELRS